MRGEVRVGLTLVGGLVVDPEVVVDDSFSLTADSEAVVVDDSFSLTTDSLGLAMRAAGLLGSSACGQILLGAGLTTSSCILFPGVGSDEACVVVVGGVDHTIGAGRIVLPLPLPRPLGCRLAVVNNGGIPLRLAGGGDVRVAGLELSTALAPEPGCLAAIWASITGELQDLYRQMGHEKVCAPCTSALCFRREAFDVNMASQS